jgi:hypothetical protein
MNESLKSKFCKESSSGTSASLADKRLASNYGSSSSEGSHISCAKLREQILTVMRSVELHSTPGPAARLTRSQGSDTV